MVAEINEKDKKVFQCGECNFNYLEKDRAVKCEEYCKNFHSCNLEIIKHAIKEDK